ncbi:MAG: bacteriophage N4 adsorption protein A, partial [Vicinamibacteria bacterium]
PSNREHRSLLIDALLAASRLEEADDAIRQAAAQFGNDQSLQSRRVALRERMAAAPANAAYAALSRLDMEGAVTNARAAVRLAPENQTYALVLIHALVQAGDFPEAERFATEAFVKNPADSRPLVLRAYARQRLGRREEAVNDLDIALHQQGMTAASHRAIQLIAADAALAAGEPARAMNRLTGWPRADDEDVALRVRAARAQLTSPLKQVRRGDGAAFVPPTLDCSRTATPVRCDVVPGAARDPAVDLAAAAYQAFDREEFVDAVGFARQAVSLMPENNGYQWLLVRSLVSAGQDKEAERAASAALVHTHDDASLFAQRGFIRQRLAQHAEARADFETALRIGGLPASEEISVLAEVGRLSEARLRFDEGREDGTFSGASTVELAYIQARVGDDKSALASFQKADAAGELPNTAYEDAAFTAIRAHEDATAIGYFSRSSDAIRANSLDITPQRLFETRRATSEVSRRTGVIASLTYRGPVSGLGVSSEGGADTLQAGVEAYWRPAGYRNARYLELFARAFGAPYIKDNRVPFKDTLQSTIGVRHKPFHEVNLVASFGRVFSSGAGRNDWLAQVGYSGSHGGDLRTEASSWSTIRTAAEGGRYLDAQQNYALARVEAGQSILLSSLREGWVLFPHLSVAADYDSTLGEERSAGAGPGLNLRRWFHQDDDHAPRSTLELSVQYRWRLIGARRARGLFLTTTLSY